MANQQAKSNYVVPHGGSKDEQGQERQDMYMDCFHEYEVSASGLTHIKYARADDPSKNFNTRVGPMGEYEDWDRNGDAKKSVFTEMFPNAKRKRSQNESSNTKDNTEHSSGGVHNSNHQNEVGKTTTKNEMSGITNNNLVVHGNDGRVRTTSTFMNASDKGIHIQTTSGENRIYHEGNQVTTTQGAHYQIHQSDCGVHCQKDGNYDVRTQKGKLQIQTGKGELTVKSGSTMMINASSKITIQVGGSTITVESGQVTIKSQKITLDGESHIGGQGGQLAGLCGGGCATKVYNV